MMSVEDNPSCSLLLPLFTKLLRRVHYTTAYSIWIRNYEFCMIKIVIQIIAFRFVHRPQGGK